MDSTIFEVSNASKWYWLLCSSVECLILFHGGMWPFLNLSSCALSYTSSFASHVLYLIISMTHHLTVESTSMGRSQTSCSRATECTCSTFDITFSVLRGTWQLFSPRYPSKGYVATLIVGSRNWWEVKLHWLIEVLPCDTEKRHTTYDIACKEPQRYIITRTPILIGDGVNSPTKVKQQSIKVRLGICIMLK